MGNPKRKHRFYVPPECFSDNFAVIKLPEYHHVVDVVRCKEGDTIMIFNGQGIECKGRIVSVDRTLKKANVAIEEICKKTIMDRDLILLQGLAKGSKMDFIVQKAAELGVTAIVPVKTKCSVVKLDSKREGVKLNKWRRIVQEASKQCGRAKLPVVEKIQIFEEVLNGFDGVETKIICTIQDVGISLKSISKKKSKSIALAVGPEGGFTKTEVELARSRGWVPVRIGDTVMRTETAALVMLGIVCYEFGYWE